MNPVKRARSELLHSSFKEEGRKLFMNIPVEDRDSIWNFNLGFNAATHPAGIFWQNGVIQSNRIPLFFMLDIDPKLAETDDITKHYPKWVLLEHTYDYAGDYAGKTSSNPAIIRFRPGYDFIEANYERIARTDTTICDIELWKRKEATTDSESIEIVEEQE